MINQLIVRLAITENYPKLFDKAKMELYHFVNYNNF